MTLSSSFIINQDSQNKKEATLLRDYQQRIVEKTLDAIAQGKTPLVYAPTGAGKTEIAIAISRKLGGVLFVAPGIEIALQTQERFEGYGVPCGIIQGRNKVLETYTTATYQSLVKLKDLVSPKLLVLDECHHSSAKSYQDLIAHYRELRIPIVGLTATPYLLSRKNHLSDTYDEVVSEVDTRMLISRGCLSPYTYYAAVPKTLVAGLEALKVARGDYTQVSMENLMTGQAGLDAVIAAYQKYGVGKPTLIFASSVLHSSLLAESLRHHGYSAQSLVGNTKVEDREAIIKRFRKNKLDVLVSVNCLAEGFDAPNAEVGILARPTKSRGLYVQQVGRLLRKNEGKPEALIVDLVGNWARHGLPDRPFCASDVLVRREVVEEDFTQRCIVCPSCLSVQEVGNTHCLHCGYELSIVAAIKSRKKNKQEELEVGAICQEVVQEIYDLLDWQKLSGYKPKWVFYRLAETEIAPLVSIRELGVLAKEIGYRPKAAYYLWQEWQEIMEKKSSKLEGTLSASNCP